MTMQEEGAARRQVSLRRLIVSRLLVYILPIVTAVMIISWHLERRLLTEVFDDSLRDRAMTLATLITARDGRAELEFADEYMPRYSRSEEPYYFQIWRPDGSLLEKSYSLGTDELPKRVGTVDDPIAFPATLADGTSVRAVGIDFPVRLGTDPSSGPAVRVAVVVAAEGTLLQRRLATGLGYVVLTGLALGLGLTVVVFASLRRASSLLQRVVDEVGDIDRTRLEQRLAVDAAPVEIQPILAALNEALDAISRSMEREHRFTSDVAHELRTPISELRAATEVALRWPEESGDADVVREAHEIAVQMSAMVESLLQLSRLEGMTLEQDAEELDATELVTGQLERVAKLREAPTARVRVVDRGLRSVQGSRALWEVVLGNLLDNALEHSPSGSPIEVALVSTDGERWIEVENEASCPLPDGASRATERLWRGDAARAQPNHFGLGLSIVEAACEKLGVELSLRAEDGRFSAALGIPREQLPSRVA